MENGRHSFGQFALLKHNMFNTFHQPNPSQWDLVSNECWAQIQTLGPVQRHWLEPASKRRTPPGWPVLLTHLESMVALRPEGLHPLCSTQTSFWYQQTPEHGRSTVVLYYEVVASPCFSIVAYLRHSCFLFFLSCVFCY